MNISVRPVSSIIKSQDSEEPKKRTRDEWRKAKELEEMRKAGTAPAQQDEEGKYDITDNTITILLF
jgi:pre-mRNA-processing factor SLU7